MPIYINHLLCNLTLSQIEKKIKTSIQFLIDLHISETNTDAMIFYR